MRTSVRKSLLFKAVIVSINLNALMILLGMIGNFVKSLSVLGAVSKVIAAPPGVLMRLLLHPRANSPVAIVAVMFGGLVVSIIFYPVIAWIVLRLMAYRRSSKTEDSLA